MIQLPHLPACTLIPAANLCWNYNTYFLSAKNGRFCPKRRQLLPDLP
jgi:hypothetical protein